MVTDLMAKNLVSLYEDRVLESIHCAVCVVYLLDLQHSSVRPGGSSGSYGCSTSFSLSVKT